MSEEVKQEALARPCPCGSGKSWEECCGRYVDGDMWPTTAEELVRARYSAYHERKFDYLVKTALPEASDDASAEKLDEATKNVEWVRLEIVDSGERAIDDEGNDCELVDFFAYYRIEGSTFQLGERGWFHEVDGKLFYARGEKLRSKPIQRQGAKVGRNDPCPCGSGKKYKKCCGRNA